jgi:DNA-binding IclR family transcriptional regulator
MCAKAINACASRPTSARRVSVTVPLGAVLPLSKGSGGRVLLAWAEDRGRFPVDAAVLAEVRKAGWAATVGEREAGVASVSAPVRVGVQVIAALGVSGPAERLGSDPGTRFAEPVLAAAADLARARGAPVTTP